MIRDTWHETVSFEPKWGQFCPGGLWEKSKIENTSPSAAESQTLLCVQQTFQISTMLSAPLTSQWQVCLGLYHMTGKDQASHCEKLQRTHCSLMRINIQPELIRCIHGQQNLTTKTENKINNQHKTNWCVQGTMHSQTSHPNWDDFTWASQKRPLGFFKASHGLPFNDLLVTTHGDWKHPNWDDFACLGLLRSVPRAEKRLLGI